MLVRSKRAENLGERGQVIVFFALLIPVIFGIGAVVLDVGNWYVHKRHLQTQVDAAVLAAAPLFTGCARDAAQANVHIRDVALGYAGDTLRPGRSGPNQAQSTTNLQVQQPDDVRVALNSSRFWSPTDGYVPGTNGYGLDDTIAVPGDPCATRFIDAKATDEDAPLLWGLIPVSPSPKTIARVEMRRVRSQAGAGMLPFAVPELSPSGMFALFVNEDNGTILASQPLDPQDDVALPWSEWETRIGQEAVTFDGLHVNTGVVILVSSEDPAPSVGGSIGDVCTDGLPLVRCYGGSTATSGLSFIHGYSGGFTGAPTSPQVRQVRLTPFGCPTPPDYSAPYFTLTGGCTAGVEAVIDFGIAGDPTRFNPQGTNPASIGCARVAGFTWSPGGLGQGLGTWTSTIGLPAGAGRQAVNLSWITGNRQQGNSGNCHNNQTGGGSGVLNKVAAAYVGDDASGPIEYLKLEATKTDGSGVDAHSIETTETYNYVVTAGIRKPLSIANWDDPPVLLRDVLGGSPSQTQTWDCNPVGNNLRDWMEDGCQTFYDLNYDDHDGDGDLEWRDVECTGYGPTNLPPGTTNPDPAPDCVLTYQGGSVGQFRDGVVARWRSNPDTSYTDYPCWENHWPESQAEADEFFDEAQYVDDPRYVTLLVTSEFGIAPGREAIPVKYWAAFYVTGWSAHAQQAPACADNDPHPEPPGSGADLWGYFVNIVQFSSPDVIPSDDLCVFGTDPATCVAVLVK